MLDNHPTITKITTTQVMPNQLTEELIKRLEVISNMTSFEAKTELMKMLNQKLIWNC